MTAGSTPAVLPARFARLVKIEHTVFALPFAYVGAFLAVRGTPSGHDLLWITLAMVAACESRAPRKAPRTPNRVTIERSPSRRSISSSKSA